MAADRRRPAYGRPAVHAPDLPHSDTFPWSDTAERLRALLELGPLLPDATGRWYEQHVSGQLVAALRPPLVLLRSEGLPPADQLEAQCAAGPGKYGVLLLQAGATALGLFEDNEVLDHKAFKRYVVRGKGRAQPTHLRAGGRSRRGARLRLRNAKRLLEAVSERLGAWWDETPAPSRLYVSCPVRLYADLCAVQPTPPVTVNDPRRVPIPLDVAVPTHAELMRVHRSINRGRAWWIGA